MWGVRSTLERLVVGGGTATQQVCINEGVQEAEGHRHGSGRRATRPQACLPAHTHPTPNLPNSPVQSWHLSLL